MSRDRYEVEDDDMEATGAVSKADVERVMRRYREPLRTRPFTRKQLIEAAIAVAIVGLSFILAILLSEGGR